MVAFDVEKDKTIAEETLEFPEKGTSLVVAVKCYNEGVKKIHIARKNKYKETEKFSKLGRLTKEEAQSLLAVLPAMINVCD